jgi:DNA repair exonuclease SbcCD nuclease subunit
MSNLFKKAAMFTDIHFGLKNNSVQHLTDCENFVDWFIATAKEQGCETGFFLGDWHHHRASINLQTLNYSLRALEKLNDAFENFYFLAGNHDLYYRDKRDIHGAEWAKHLPNVHVINDWFTEGNVTIAPWLVGDDHKRVKQIKSKYVMGHFELPHFKMNQMVEMPDTGEINASDLDGIDRVFSGHFHMRQNKGNITYIGNAFPHNFADAGDEQRGATIIDWDGEPEFYNWPEQPTYRVIDLSALIDHADQVLKPNMHVRVNLDIDISYEEANFIKETFANGYGLRDISLLPKAKNQEHGEQEGVDVGIFQSVDQIITEQLTSVDSDYYNKQLLLDIYNNL